MGWFVVLSKSFLGSLMWPPSVGGSAGGRTKPGLLALFPHEVFHPQGGKTELLHVQFQGSVPTGQSPNRQALIKPSLLMSHWPKQVKWPRPESV